MVATLAAQEKGREATAIEQHHRLLVAIEAFTDSLEQAS
jgi:hypothetical protein